MGSRLHQAVRLSAVVAIFFLSSTPGQSAIAPASVRNISISADFANPELSVNEAMIVQTGNTNLVALDQETTISGKGNFIEVNQNGSYNEAQVIQTGDSNRARIDQTGNYNTANIMQNGSGNSIDLAQLGNGNVFYAAQTGNNNRIVASQR